MTSIIVNGDTDSIYIQQVGALYYYSINDSGPLIAITSFPITIQNTSVITVLYIFFKTNLTITNSNFYFICNSALLQFGNQDRNPDGSRVNITVSGVANYPGFIQNGTATTNGYSTVSIYNIIINSSASTLATSGLIGSGWLGQSYYSKSAADNKIVNCASNGTIVANCGGIVGSNACTGGNATLQITGCSSTGTITSYAGGIVGRGCATSSNDQLTIEYCWTSGAIATYSGGITGNGCGMTSGIIICTNCYSTGAITDNSGGIIGSTNGYNGGFATAEKCYSRGSIGVNCGGIYGINAGQTNGFAISRNCYSSGTIALTAGGIYAVGYVLSQISAANCYTSGTMTSPNGGILAGSPLISTTNYAEGVNANTGWKNVNAAATLLGAPISNAVYGITWCQPNGLNTPYILTDMGYTPYEPQLLTTAQSNVIAGQSSPVAFVPGYTYSIFTINGQPSLPGFTINASTGSITTAISVTTNIYNIVVYSTNDSYSITNYTLGVSTPTTNIKYILQITLNSAAIFNGYFLVDSGTTVPNIVAFYEDGNTSNLLAPPGSYGKNNNEYVSLSNPFDAFGVNITTMNYYALNYGSNNIPPPNGDATYNFKNFNNGTGTILNFSQNIYNYTITQIILPTTIIANGETDTIYIEQAGALYYYSINDGALISLAGFPITIQNTSVNTVLPIIFRTSLTITSPTFYFICGSAFLQFGRTDRNDDGSRPTITVSGITNYPGLIQNGTATTNGYSNTFIYNLIINSSSSTLLIRGGWLGQAYYGKGASGNVIINCNSNGDISSYSGGITGSYTCTGGNAALDITGCGSTGAMTSYAGGIVGSDSATFGVESTSIRDTLTIQRCWSSGAINNNSGGITGYFCGTNGGVLSCRNCYSTGAITDNSGGIIGSTNGYNVGSVTVINAYSRGSIGVNCGGIYGINAAQGNGVATSTNCYSSGTIALTAGGIYGVGYNIQNTPGFRCYTSGTMTSPNGGIFAGSPVIGFSNYAEGVNANTGWQDVNAETTLDGAKWPLPGPVPPFFIYIWRQPNGPNTPYVLTEMGYTPYVQPLATTASSSVIAGQSSPVAFVPGYTYSILAINNEAPMPGFTINASTGSITTSTSVAADTYIITIYSSIDSYSITRYTLTVVNINARTTFCINIRLENELIFNGTFLVDATSTSAPNIVAFYEDGNTSNLLAPPGSYGNNNNTFVSLLNPFDSNGVNITTMSYYAGNYGSNNIPPPDGDATYNFKNFINGIGTIFNFSENTYEYTIIQCVPPTPIPEPPIVYCPTPIKCRFCYSYKPPGLVEPTCIPVVCASNQFLSTISLLPEVTNNSTRTIESSLLQAMVKKQQQCIEQQTVNSTIQSTIANAAAINENVFSELINLKNQRYVPYQPYIYPVVPPSVMELQMRTANVGVGVSPDTIMNCKGSQFVTT